MSLNDDFSDINVYNEFDFEYEDYSEETLFDVWNNCIVLSIYGILPMIINLVLLNFIFGCVSRFLSKTSFHILSGIIGIYLINTLDSTLGKYILLVCFLGSFIIFHISKKLSPRCNVSSSNLIKILSVFQLILCEYYLVSSGTWLQIRGTVMVLMMKLISLAVDTEKSNYRPNFIEYFGYMLCGANVLFGPWVPIQVYLNLYEKPTNRNIYWVYSIIKLLAISLCFLTLSNCWGNYLITDNVNRWLVAYKEAFSFRTSHYFVCYLAEVTMVSFGFNATKKNAESSPWRYTITEPLDIEFPSSLAIVVQKWNQPMHEFLKKYIYRSWLSHGRFLAIFTTFLMSSFLHGLELKVSMVLINIGVFSYLQVAPRQKISEIFDSCLKVRPCKDCKHKYKRNDPRVKFVLFLYSLATIIHLAYLGVLMDPSTEEIGIFGKWQHLSFLSHIVMFFNLLIIL